MNKREAFLLDTRINVLALTTVFKPQTMCYNVNNFNKNNIPPLKYKIEPDQCLLILFDPKLDFLKVDQLPQCIILISERKCHTNNENDL